MKKGTAILAVVCALLLSYIFLVERKHPAKTIGQDNPPLFQTTAENIRRIQIHRPDVIVVLERKSDKNWQITSPLADIADSQQVESFVQNFVTLRSMGAVTQSEKPEAYGFTPNAVQLTVELKSGPPIELRLGSEAPTQQGYYSYIPATGELKLISASFAQMILNPVDSWRDHVAIHFDPEKVEKISIDQGSQHIQFEQMDNFWWMKSPMQFRALTSKVTELLSALANMRISSFDVPPTELFGTIQIKIWETGNKNPKMVFIDESLKTPTGIGGMTFGKNGSLNGGSRFYVLPESSVAPLRLKPMAFRDYHLVAFNPDEITKIDVLKGNRTFTFVKDGKTWKVTVPAKNEVPGWKAELILKDLELLEEPKLSNHPNPIAHPQAIVTLWNGQQKLAQVAVGDKTIIQNNLYLPVDIQPGRKLAFSNAQFLIRDLIW